MAGRLRCILSAWLAAFAWAGEPGYIDSSQCRSCHREIYESYERTAMGRSISEPDPAMEGAYVHLPSNRRYRVTGGRMWRYPADAAGDATSAIERSIDLTIGSGNHARTFAHRTAQGRWVQLPLSWYAESGGTWAMSPGYDRAGHLDFRREIASECLFCHAAYPNGSETLSAIDCQRCHGPGARHVDAPSKASIVNPARLPKAAALEVCLQCHLETGSRGFPDSMRRPGRTVYSYRPGERLSGYKLYFEPAGGRDRFEINSAGYRLLQSACFLKSDGKLTCTSCHDAHALTATVERTRFACQSCHSSEHADAISNCASCHMPARRATDAVRVVMTDHRIQRKPGTALLAPLAEDHSAYSGPIIPFYTEADPLSLAAAQVREFNNLARGILDLEQALAARPGSPAGYHLDLAEAYRRTGNLDKSITSYRAALAQEPDSVRALAALGDALLRTGKLTEAVQRLERAHRIDENHPGAATALAVAYGAAGRNADALKLLQRTVAIHPDHPGAWINLGVAWEQHSNFRMAEAAYREALRIQPDSVDASRRLARLMQEQHRP